ncbi:MAG: hypothetical protein U5L96_21155 [Owenweeksia sp.]|nr:hypothetical protein [Owenweeksia sp.]
MTNDQAQALMSFMDTGGNVLVAGQDIGWSINDPNGYGTTTTRLFYK